MLMYLVLHVHVDVPLFKYQNVVVLPLARNIHAFHTRVHMRSVCIVLYILSIKFTNVHVKNRHSLLIHLNSLMETILLDFYSLFAQQNIFNSDL